jgi:hypothetical protein
MAKTRQAIVDKAIDVLSSHLTDLELEYLRDYADHWDLFNYAMENRAIESGEIIFNLKDLKKGKK